MQVEKRYNCTNFLFIHLLIYAPDRMAPKISGFVIFFCLSKQKIVRCVMVIEEKRVYP